MSVAERSCASRTASRRSGWAAREGGERRRVRGRLPFFSGTLFCEVGVLKSEVMSRVTAGAMTGEILSGFCFGGAALSTWWLPGKE